MMITTPSDASAVFALLAAISDPDTAKQNLQDIADASSEFQKSIEDSRIELKQARDDLSSLKDEVDAKNAETIQMKNDFDTFNASRTKQLNDLGNSLAVQQANNDANTASLTTRLTDVSRRETEVTTRENQVTDREIAAQQLFDSAQAIKTDYTSKLANLQAMVGVSQS